MALYKSALFQTPQLIQYRLNDDEIGIYKIPSINEVFVSNKWDTIPISSDNSSKIVFYEILPARGPGGKQLELIDLNIEDSRNSNSLYNLIEKLESYGIKIQKETRYDD
ncbi:hypothetical protein [Mucilaginibacter polytrichastri]|uniref:Uncharacterized protein n=1 Tax=Mucilaginibacter polytrichastri TaxID=1302689 RepID=A0A1Q6A396_9SPHI|nr:hypothetical protein [Mucilaginibacter polytrichastri]OKS88485.1 hypothetical protein RG47T_3952 [Mucilaginibacter polytrichastri]SFT12151.1 hypothetical protein SAMN04487890_111139 [Mucilaginibacter polytrichastri]